MKSEESQTSNCHVLNEHPRLTSPSLAVSVMEVGLLLLLSLMILECRAYTFSGGDRTQCNTIILY